MTSLQPYSLLLICRKLVYRSRLVAAAFLQDRRWEVGFVGGIREMLCLEAESVARVIDFAFLSFKASVEEIADIELDARFRRQNLHHAASRRFNYFCSGSQRSGFAIDHKIVIITLAQF